MLEGYLARKDADQQLEHDKQRVDKHENREDQLENHVCEAEDLQANAQEHLLRMDKVLERFKAKNEDMEERSRQLEHLPTGTGHCGWRLPLNWHFYLPGDNVILSQVLMQYCHGKEIDSSSSFHSAEDLRNLPMRKKKRQMKIHMIPSREEENWRSREQVSPLLQSGKGETKEELNGTLPVEWKQQVQNFSGLKLGGEELEGQGRREDQEEHQLLRRDIEEEVNIRIDQADTICSTVCSNLDTGRRQHQKQHVAQTLKVLERVTQNMEVQQTAQEYRSSQSGSTNEPENTQDITLKEPENLQEITTELRCSQDFTVKEPSVSTSKEFGFTKCCEEWTDAVKITSLEKSNKIVSVSQVRTLLEQKRGSNDFINVLQDDNPSFTEEPLERGAHRSTRMGLEIQESQSPAFTGRHRVLEDVVLSDNWSDEIDRTSADITPEVVIWTEEYSQVDTASELQQRRTPKGLTFSGPIPQLIVTQEPSPCRSLNEEQGILCQNHGELGPDPKGLGEVESPCSDSGCGGSPVPSFFLRKMSSSSSAGLSSASSFDESEDDFGGSDLEHTGHHLIPTFGGSPEDCTRDCLGSRNIV
ncbi:hypothetical protein NDU88_003012 [Pleurodeles waltl]|uniref:Uncharacterized protein n=1 Tax=Pleurodeles waltl TaxID=8319 RepID=A0AAV7MQK1_PLEWA|nr:hypothetical protein NDU88_003012 [Pleurodeles waltl]